MKKSIILLVSLLSFITVAAQIKVDNETKRVLTHFMSEAGVNTDSYNKEDSYRSFLYSMDDTQFDWSQSENKTTKVMLKNQGLILENKIKEATACSVVELPVNLEREDFIYGVTFLDAELGDDVNIGLLFDYENNHNYKGIGISKKQFRYFSCKDNVTSDIKTGLIKYKGKVLNLLMERKQGKVFFYINDIEIAKFNRVKIDNEFFGVYLYGKGKTTIPYFIFNIPQKDGDSEESTSDM